MINLINAHNSVLNDLGEQWSLFLSDHINSDLPQEENIAILEVAILSKLEPISANVFGDLNKSLIDGEYSNNISLAKTKLNEIEGLITLRANFDIPDNLNLTSFCQHVFTESFLLPLRTAIKDFKRLLELVERRLNFEPEINTLFHIYKREEITPDVNSHKDLRLFKLNIQVALTDFSFSYDNATFRKLISIGRTLSDLASVGSVSDILKKKCDFLVNKLTHRLDSERTNRYAIDFQYQSIEPHNIPELDYYDEIIKGHYDNVQTEEFKNRFRAALSTLKNNSQNLTFDDYHALIKYFKDIKPNLKNLQILKSQYESFYSNSSSLSDFDKKSRELLYCYLENNILSRELEENKFTLETWDEKFEIYTRRAENLKNSNFFPYYKIIDQFLIHQIRIQFSEDKINIENLERLINSYELHLDTFTKNLKICEETNYLTFQLDFNGCITEIADVNGISWKCFIASSFVLPMDYSYWYKIAENLRTELLKIKALFELHVSLKKDVSEIYTIKEKLAESDKRHIEILSIFAAIVMFVSNEVQMFSNLKNVKDAVIFTLFFAFSLGLFVMLIWFVTRPTTVNLKKLPLTHRLLIILFVLGFVAAGVYLFFDSSSQSSLMKKEQGTVDRQIDSLKKKVTLDSLRQVQVRYLKTK